MYCPECGFQNSDAANYCSKCGALIVPEQPGAQTTMSFAPAEFDADTATAALDELAVRRARAGHPRRRRPGRRALPAGRRADLHRPLVEGRHPARRRHGVP